MGIRQLKNGVIIFIVFFCGSVLGLKSELVKATILSVIILPFLYLLLMIIMIIYLQFDYDDLKSLYKYLEEVNKEKLKIQLSCNMDIESIEDKVLEYNMQVSMIGNKLILDAERCLANKRYKKIIPKEVYKVQAEKILKIVEKTKKIIRKTWKEMPLWHLLLYIYIDKKHKEI